jgi:hypothetical protein
VSILEPDRIDPNDPDALAAVVADAAARGCSRSAQWLLEHHPAHRPVWSDQGAVHRALHQLLGAVADGIATSGLSIDDQQRVILAMQARGAGVPVLGGAEDA